MAAGQGRLSIGRRQDRANSERQGGGNVQAGQVTRTKGRLHGKGQEYMVGTAGGKGGDRQGNCAFRAYAVAQPATPEKPRFCRMGQ